MIDYEKKIDDLGGLVCKIATQAPPALESTWVGLKAIQAELAAFPAKDLVQACELIMAVRYVMAFLHIHDVASAQEVLNKYDAVNVHHLANKAQQAAERALKALETNKPTIP